MDDVLIIRIALDNVHPPELGENARKALDRLLEGEIASVRPSTDGRGHELPRGQSSRSPRQVASHVRERATDPASRQSTSTDTTAVYSHNG